jgi:predicted ATP-dependent endonuclease of OLD family
MELIKFRVCNYKSIRDSGDCFFTKGYTILAGKNESGKTSLLEALEDFDERKTVREDASPIESGQDDEPLIYLTVQLSQEDAASLDDKFNWLVENALEKDLTIVKTKDKYSITQETQDAIGVSKLLDSAANETRAEFAKLDLPEQQASVSESGDAISEFLEALTDEEFDGQEEQIKIIKIRVASEKAMRHTALVFPQELVKQCLPYFNFYSSFFERFPDEISVADLESNTWVRDLEGVSSFERNKIASSNSQTQRSHEIRVNAEFSEKFKKYWTQDPIRLEVSKNGDMIHFWILENDTPYKPSQRSQGQQWYLSFYIRVVAKINEDKPNVILIDEPGLYLHAQAQKDMLTVLNDSLVSAEHPIVFSTHSPYLITSENLESVRLVEKTDRETRILGKIHSHSKADKETLTPILTAIGLGMNDSITNLEQRDNIVVEGPEDVFYLQAFKEILPKEQRPQFNFISGGGSGNVGIVGAILEGWGCNVKYLFDNDQGGKDGITNLDNRWYVMVECIKTVLPDKKDSTIADILSKDDFQKYVLEGDSADRRSNNSTILKNGRGDKVLFARRFLQKAKTGDVHLDDKSISNIKSLFAKLAFTD